jgi:hypothetical protein
MEGLAMIFEYFDSEGVRFLPLKYNGQHYRTVEPRWLVKESGRFSEANSDDVLFDHLRRGFHVWMVSHDRKTTKLVAPEHVIMRFEPA